MNIGNPSTQIFTQPTTEHFKIAINGKEHKNLDIRQLKEGVSLEEAQKVLNAEKDGFDTVGVEIDGVNYLISGKGITADTFDSIEIEGQAAGSVSFVEQENNAFREGFKAGIEKASKTGLQYSVAAAPLMTMAGLAGGAVATGRGLTAKDDVLEKLTEGPVITPQLMEEAVEAIESIMDF